MLQYGMVKGDAWMSFNLLSSYTRAYLFVSAGQEERSQLTFLSIRPPGLQSVPPLLSNVFLPDFAGCAVWRHE